MPQKSNAAVTAGGAELQLCAPPSLTITKKRFFSLTSVLVYGEIAAETKLLIQRICLSGHNLQRDPPMAQSQTRNKNKLKNPNVMKAKCLTSTCRFAAAALF